MLRPERTSHGGVSKCTPPISHLKKSMNVEQLIINQGEWLLDALSRAGYENTPTNTVLDKTLTGLGATHAELTPIATRS